MEKKFVLIFALVLAMSFDLTSTAPSPDESDEKKVRDFSDNVKQTVYNEVERIYGGTCQADNQCSVISYCKQGNGSTGGSCFFTWWFILIIVILICLLLSAICSCICCPCCCLYDLCCCCCH